MPKPLTQTEFLKRAGRVHHDKYTYEEALYQSMRTPVVVTCPYHGDFSVLPKYHLDGVGCPDCRRHPTLIQFTTEAKQVHGSRYEYPLQPFKSFAHPVLIVCRAHGEFYQRANKHLQGHGCPRCGVISSRQSIIDCHADMFVTRANRVHKGFYQYGNVHYKGTRHPVRITCPIHGDFLQTPSNHLQGRGCGKCRGRIVRKN